MHFQDKGVMRICFFYFGTPQSRFFECKAVAIEDDETVASRMVMGTTRPPLRNDGTFDVQKDFVRVPQSRVGWHDGLAQRTAFHSNETRRSPIG
jgi:hypothetical protein